MKFRDMTAEASERDNAVGDYLHFAQSPQDRWALVVEVVEADRYNVSVMLKEPDWDVFGAVRYWAYDDRALAEARYLELHRHFEAVEDEAMELKALLNTLPAEERQLSEAVEAEESEGIM